MYGFGRSVCSKTIQYQQGKYCQWGTIRHKEIYANALEHGYNTICQVVMVRRLTFTSGHPSKYYPSSIYLTFLYGRELMFPELCIS